ncbi:MAG: TonB-dependent receptor [Bacteroidota bacterium]
MLTFKLEFSGKLPLIEVLDSLSQEINLAYSRDKLPTTKVDANFGQSLESWLEELHNNKVLEFRLEEEQIIISPFIPRSYTVNGVLRDSETGEHIIGASILVMGTNLGTFTNGYGYFSITLSEGEYKVEFSHIGYSSLITNVDLSKNVHLKASITPQVTVLDEIEVSALEGNIHIIENIPSIDKIYINETAGQIPYLLGEVDVNANALLQPGIKAIGEDASGIHIRGGAVDQNLILLDEATIYNPNHFFGLVSVFNPEAVNDIRIMKGYIPPSYGGRASSVIEVRQKEGNNERLSYSGGIGVVSARALIEGPIKKGKSSFLVSGRQSLLNLSISDFDLSINDLVGDFGNSSVRRNTIRFQDWNVKLNAKPNTSNQFFISAYYGKDRNAVGLNSIRRWGNSVFNFRWNHLYSPQLFSNISTFVSEYNATVEDDDEPGAFKGTSRIRDFGLKADFSYSFKRSNEINFGFNTIFHSLLPGRREPLNPDANSTNIIELDKEAGLESAIYLGHDFTLGNVSFNYGARYSALHNFGPEDVFIYQDNDPTSDAAVIDTVSFSRAELVNSFRTLEPRIAMNWIINSKTSIKASFTRNAQYIHLISNTITPAPTDIWKLTDDYIPPLRTDQYTLGLYKNFKDNTWEASSEIYYKDISNNILYKDGADLIFNENIETELLLTDARAYGLEFYLKKRKGRLKGWISYSLSRTESKIDENNQERYIVENFDKTHDFSVSWSLNLSKRLSISSNFIYNTGIPVTLPTDKYVFENNLVPNFGTRNNERLPDYHRLDLSLRIKGKAFKKNGERRKNRDFWIFTIYNVYARRNAYSYFFRESDVEGLGEIVRYSIFGIPIPSITYNFKF